MNQKIAYLTIDDSPTAGFRDKMLYLKEKAIPAVFFCIGQLMEQRPDELIESIHKGFIIANHSYSHPAFSKISLEQAKEEIEKTDEIIASLYQKAGVQRPTKWFRFPYGDKGDLKNGKVFGILKKGNNKRKNFIQNVLQNLGYTQPSFKDVDYKFMKKAKLLDDIDWSWTFDIMEWSINQNKPTQGIKDLNSVISRMQKQRPSDCRGFLGFEKRWLASTSSEIILLHDHSETDKEFKTIIDTLLTLNLNFKDLPLQ